MTCWCTGRVTRRIHSVRLALLLSIALHAVLCWWVLRSSKGGTELPQRSPPAERRLLIKLLPPANALTVPPFSSSLPTSPESPRQTRRKELFAAPQPNNASQTSTLALTPAPPVIDPFPVESGSGAIPQAHPLRLELGRAALSADRDRRQSPLANEVDAKAQQAANSNQSRAFSALNTTPSGIVGEATTADSGRLVRFSGGGCMKLPNPAARQHDDVRKPTVGNC